jgi:hypothetical protein
VTSQEAHSVNERRQRNVVSAKTGTYRYKKEIDVTQSLDYGLAAKKVASIDPNLVVCGNDGQVETVRYTAANAMLLNEF